MASVKLICRRNTVYKDGTSPIYLSVIHNRKQYKKTLAKVPLKHIHNDKVQIKRSFPQFDKINLILQRELNSAEAYLNNCRLYGKPIDVRIMLNGGDSVNLIQIMQREVVELRKKEKVWTPLKYESIISKLKRFDPNPILDSIDLNWVERFDLFLEKKIGNGPNTRGKELKIIKKFCPNKAFDGFSIPSKVTMTESLTIKEKELLEETDFQNELVQLAVDCWLFSLYNRGMRVFDVLTIRPGNIIDGRLKYTSDKGKGKYHDIELSQKSLDIISKYKGGYYVFPMTKSKFQQPDIFKYKKHVNAKNVLLNKRLKVAGELCGIKKKLTMHVARHTFTAILDEMGASVRDLQALLGHSNRETTEIYMRKLRQTKELDDVVRGKL